MLIKIPNTSNLVQKNLEKQTTKERNTELVMIQKLQKLKLKYLILVIELQELILMQKLQRLKIRYQVFLIL